MVFEGLVADVLSKVLGQYVKNLNKDQLKIGIFGGNVVLQNLELKEDALSELNLPIDVVKGYLGKLEAKVPWKNLKSQPVIVNLDNIFLLAGPHKQSFKYDEEAERKKALEIKKKQIENFELMQSLKAEDGEKDGKKDSFTTKLVTKIVDNLQIYINKVHIRYEDTKDDKTFALGITLSKISANSTDENWKSCFLDIDSTATRHKLAEMNDLSVYLDPNAKPMRDLSSQEFFDSFTRLITTAGSPVNHHYLINPISATLKLKMNKNEQMDKSIPKILVDCVFGELALALSEPQFHSILQLLQLVNNFSRDIKYLKYRPTKPVKQDPRAWWKYAYNVVLIDVKMRRERQSWTYILARRKQRLEYINLYKRKQDLKWLTPLKKDELLRLNDLEEELTFEDIVYFRSMADAEIKKEAANYKQRAEYEKSKGIEKKGFFSSIFSRGPSAEQKQALLEAAPTVELTQEQKEELYKTIGYDEVVSETVMPKDYVAQVANLEVKAISFQLNSTRINKPLIHASLDKISLKVNARQDAVKADVAVQAFTIVDKATEGTLFPQLVAPSKGAGGTQFCQVAFETNPLSGHADVVVAVRVAPLDVVVHRPLIDSITDFFKIEETMDLSELQNRTNASLERLREMTKAQLQYAVESHKTIDLLVDVRTVSLIVAELANKPDTSILVADLGNLTVKSQLTPKTTEKKGYVEDDYYDKYSISITNIKTLIANNDQNWREPEVQIRNNLHLVEDFDINLLVKQCIQPSDLSLTTIKVSGELPSLHMKLSTEKYDKIMNLVDKITGGPKVAPAVPAAEPTEVYVPATVPVPAEVVYIDAEEQERSIKEKHDPAYQKLVIAHKKVEASFKVVAVSVALTRKLPNGSEGNIVKLNVSNLEACVAVRSYDLSAQVGLQRIDIEDCIEASTSEFKYIATSHMDGSQQALIAISFVQTQRESPEYKKVDMSIDFLFNSFFFICNPPTVTALLEFALKFQRPGPPALAISPSVSPASSPTAASIPTDPFGAVAQTTTAHVHKPSKLRRKSELVKLKFAAKVNSLGVVLTESGKKLAQFAILGTQADLTMKDNSMLVQGSLRSVQLIDCTVPAENPYSKVITPRDESSKMLDFTFETFSPIEEGFPGWDSEVHLLMRAIRVNAVMGYIMRIKNYFLGPMLAPILNAPPATPALSSPHTQSPHLLSPPGAPGLAPPAATGLAPHVAQPQPQAQPVKRMKLDVKMESPAIVVPESTASANGIVVELGTLSVQNGFQTSPGDNFPLDVITLKLTSMNIKTVHGTETQILEKLNLEVDVARVLAVQTKVPSQKVSVRVSPIEFVLSEVEYVFLFKMLNSIQAQIAVVAAEVPQSLPVPAVSSPTSLVVPDAPPQQQGLVYTGATNTDLSLSLDLVSFEILHKEGKSEADSLANFEISTIRVSLQISSDNIMKVDASLNSITLLDTRPNTDSKFPELLGYRPGTTTNPPPQIAATYLRDNTSGAQAINLVVNRPALFVSPSPVFAIKDFFMLAFPPEPTKEQKEALEAAAKKENRRSHRKSADPTKEHRKSGTPDRKSGALAPVNPEEAAKRKSQSLTTGEGRPRSHSNRKSGPPPGALTVQTTPPPTPRGPPPVGPPIEATITVNNPEILLVENEKEIDTRAMVVKSTFLVKYSKNNEGKETAVVDAIKLKMFVFQPSGENNQQHTQVRPVPVLNPFNLSVNYSRSPRPGSAIMEQSIKINMQPMDLFISYQDFKLVMAILNNSMPPKPAPATPPATITTSTSTSDASLYSDTSESSTATLPPVVTTPPVDDATINAESLSLLCTALNVTLINDLNGRNVPIAELRVSDLDVGVRGWSSSLRVVTNLKVTADYFNASLNTFEPLLEYWECKCEANFGTDPKMQIIMNSEEYLNINVSHALIDTLSATYTILSTDYYHSSKKTPSTTPTGTPSASPATMRIAAQQPTITKQSPLASSGHAHMTSSSSAIALRETYASSLFHPHWIQNLSGISFEYVVDETEVIDDTLEEQITQSHEPLTKESKPITVDSGAKQPIRYTNSLGNPSGGYTLATMRNFRQHQARSTAIGLRFSDQQGQDFVRNVPNDIIGIHPVDLNGRKVICEVAWNDDGSKLVTVRSDLVIANKNTVPIWAKVEAPSKLALILPVIEPGKSTAVPLEYTQGQLWIRAEETAWSSNEDAIALSELRDLESFNKKVHVLRCAQEKNETEIFRSVLHITQACNFEGSKEAQFELNFYPPVILENLLPFPISTYVINQSRNHTTVSVPEGESVPFYYADPRKTISIALMGLTGFADAPQTLIDFEKEKEGKIAKKLVMRENATKRTLNILVEYREEVPGSRTFALYVPYWLINHSQKALYYRNPEEKSDEAVVIVPSCETGDPVPFLYSENKLNVKLANTHWSKDFSIQSGGTAGALELQDNNTTTVYEFKVHIAIAWYKFKRTKVVTFVPRYVLVNHMNSAVRVKQVAKRKYEKKGIQGPAPAISPNSTPSSTPNSTPGSTPGSTPNTTPTSTPDEKEKKKGGLSFFGRHKNKEEEKEKEKTPTKQETRKEIAEDKHSFFGRKNTNNRQLAPQNSLQKIHAAFASLTEDQPRPDHIPEDDIFTLQPNEIMAFHWPNGKRKTKRLRAQVDLGDFYSWSGGFPLDQVAEYVIKMKNLRTVNNPLTDVCVRMDVSDTDFSNYITFAEPDPENPPFRIENDTPLTLSFAQRRTENKAEIKSKKFTADDFTDKIPPRATVNYALDEPTLGTNLVACFETDYGQTKSYNISKIKAYKPIVVQVLGSDFNMTQTEIFAFVWVSGATRVLTFTMSKQRHNRYIKRMDTEQQGQKEMDVFLKLRGIGLSVIDKTPKELIYFSLAAIQIEMTQSTREITFELQLGDMQIDNQLYTTEFPVLIQSSNKEPNKPFLHVSVIKSITAASITYFRYFSVLVQEMTAQVEDGLLLACYNFYLSLPMDRFTTPAKQIEAASEKQVNFRQFKFENPTNTDANLNMTYFKLFLLNPIKINFTFSLSQEGFLHSNNPMFIILESVGLSLAKLENAPIQLNALMLEHPFCSWNALTTRITKHYTMQVINQIYKIFGSADMLGNPVGLVGNLGTGVADFFYEPAQGLVKSPKDFSVGLAKGTTSLVKNTVYGTFNTLTKLTGTLGKGIATLSMDDKYLAERNSAARKKPKHAGEGLMMGVQGLGKGLFDGVTGIVRKPVEGAMKDGVGGFAKGVAQGFVGVAVKPVAGVLDLTTRTTEGIRNTTHLITDKPRVRPPRPFYTNRVLKEYSENEAEGILLMNTIRKGRYGTDVYVFHKKVTKTHTVILTEKRLIDVKKKGTSFGYQILYEHMTNITLAKEGLVINVDPPQVLKTLEAARKTVLIKVDDESNGLMVYTKLCACVKSDKVARGELKESDLKNPKGELAAAKK
eukprot:Phypoly_transcript_00020.p1 GENE.Phypoly_transcript_00020~~Phypoly_transcript_00020.p1  ORF type:complete len:3396 (+),score=660.90 Phypoly_transcript_00020:132-10319(+)